MNRVISRPAKSAFEYLRAAYFAWASARLDRRLGVDSDFWLFVLGVNNSGSTILARVLASHPDIRSLPAEGQLLTEAFPRPDRLGVVRNWTACMDRFRWTEADDPYPALRAKKDWVRHYPRPPGILLEKSPPNTIRSRWLQQNFRPARFIAIVRNPYAVCEGMRRREGYDIEQCAWHWVRANTCLLEDLSRLEACMLLRYEDFTTNPARDLERVRAFLGLGEPFDAARYARVSAHGDGGEITEIQNLDAGSVARLSVDDLATINAIAGDLMARLGYEQIVPG